MTLCNNTKINNKMDPSEQIMGADNYGANNSNEVDIEAQKNYGDDGLDSGDTMQNLVSKDTKVVTKPPAQQQQQQPHQQAQQGKQQTQSINTPYVQKAPVQSLGFQPYGSYKNNNGMGKMDFGEKSMGGRKDQVERMITDGEIKSAEFADSAYSYFEGLKSIWSNIDFAIDIDFIITWVVDYIWKGCLRDQTLEEKARKTLYGLYMNREASGKFYDYYADGGPKLSNLLSTCKTWSVIKYSTHENQMMEELFDKLKENIVYGTIPVIKLSVNMMKLFGNNGSFIRVMTQEMFLAFGNTTVDTTLSREFKEMNGGGSSKGGIDIDNVIEDTNSTFNSMFLSNK
jgi:hypothetical protein